MKKIGLFVLFTLVFTAGYYGLNLREGEKAQPALERPQEYHRIISLAPSITETLFALGLEAQIVGVTRYCDYPPEALAKPKVGGYLDPNMEAMVALRPDLVITFPGHQALTPKLEQLGIATLQVQHQELAETLDSIRLIGAATGKETEAKALLTGLRARIKEVEDKIAGLSRPRVLVVMGRPIGSPLKEIFVAGTADPYDEMIRIAGGINAYQGDFIRVPPLSAEGIMHLNPEVIIELVSNREVQKKGWNNTTLLQDWAGLPMISAVKTGRIHLFADDFDTVPGPRFILTLEKMAQVIHPEVNWPKP
ncbi:ABC transporter substrate-binding protein [Nitrosococcus wardiae]|uniref:ABC transporter substrate-binding protein n=1 Tax=Nitrosococcus wardiae TaxID=1814290 RepID=A0A4P7C013_9GAMM|nr:helical backbone metal receptor [Nitrosococcus wardiae]QBQ54889.1 ABC transporter substrate-binding protein [Nitrosococcus wardiae]